jgi:hypothetical protein
MAQMAEVVFALERFEHADEDRLEVVGRWEGLEGRRMGRAVLTVVEAGGRRRRLNALPGGQLGSAQWRASFAWSGDVASVERAELELGRRLVVELPPPRRRRRRPSQRTGDAAPAAGATQPVDAVPAPVPPADPEAGRRLLALREALAAAERERDELRSRADRAEAARVELETQLEAARAELAERDDRLQAAEAAAVGAVEDSTRRLEAERALLAEEAARRLEAARAQAAELRTGLATAREEAERARAEAAGTIQAEAEETERLRGEVRQAREEAERALAAERAESARLREELATRAPATEPGDGEEDAPTRRMLDRVTRDLERERAGARTLRRDLESLQEQTADQRRAAAVAGVETTVEQPGTAASAGRRALAAHRLDVARAAGATRVPEHTPSAVRLWGARLVALVLAGLLLLALALIVVPLL